MVIEILIGSAILLLGRRLFWLFVGGVGFLLGMFLGAEYLPIEPEWVLYGVALVVGAALAFVAIIMQKLAVGIAGFVAGGYFTFALMERLQFDPGAILWIFLLAGGSLAAIFVLLLFDSALIFLSSLLGATLIVQSVPLDAPLDTILFGALLLVGFVAQSWQMKKKRLRPK